MSGTDAAALAVAECARALPEDIVAEILSRVLPDVAFLFRCALVCKRWRRLLADPAFLRRLWPEGGRSSLLGFLVQRHRSRFTARRTSTNIFKSRAPAFVPAPGSALGPRRRFLDSFVRDDAGLLDKAEPLAERDGLVLLRVFPRIAGRKVFSLCVCNLLTGKLDVLPPLDAACFDGESGLGYAILTFTNDGAVPHRLADGYSNLCHVLLVAVHRGDKQLYIQSFSTATAALQNWSTACANCFPGDRLFSGPHGRVAAVCCDTARWLFEVFAPTGRTMHTFDVSVNSGRVSTTEIIFDGHSPNILLDWCNVLLFLSIDARLSLLYQQYDHLMIWTQGDEDQGGTADLHFTQKILVDPERWPSGGILLATVCVGEKSGTVLVLFRSDPNCAYLLDLQSRSTTKVAGWSGSFNYNTAVSYEINWLQLFMSRLGVQL